MIYKNCKGLLLSLLLIAAMLTQIACPVDTPVHRAAKASYELAGLTRDVVTAVGKAYDDHIISLPQKNAIADKLVLIAHGGNKLNQIIVGLNQSTTPTTSQLSTINLILSSEIAGPFLGIVELLGGLTTGQAGYLRAALSGLRTAILLISTVVARDTHDLVMRRSLAYA